MDKATKISCMPSASPPSSGVSSGEKERMTDQLHHVRYIMVKFADLRHASSFGNTFHLSFSSENILTEYSCWLITTALTNTPNHPHPAKIACVVRQKGDAHSI